MKVLYSTLLYSTLTLAQNTDDVWCSKKQKKYCKGKFKENINVCFVNKKDYETSKYWKEYTLVQCPIEKTTNSFKLELVDNAQDIQNAFQKYSEGCNRIDEITIFGHANRFSTTVGDIDPYKIKSTFKVAPYEDAKCIMAPKFKTFNFSGCNTGNSCVGKINMYNYAQQLFTDNYGGNIIAPSYYHVVSTESKGYTISGFDTQLDYHANKNIEKWSYQGVIDAPSPSLAGECTIACKKIRSAYSKQLNKKCDRPQEDRDKILNDYKKIEYQFIGCDIDLKTTLTTKQFFEEVEKNYSKTNRGFSSEISEILANNIHWAEQNIENIKCKVKRDILPSAAGRDM
jgi:hypothetical protein